MRRVAGKGHTHYYLYGIYEVYRSPKGWTEGSLVPECESLEELKENHRLMGESFRGSMLDHATGKEIKR
jgi:hypothetical protein